jgi:hypothetical protein
MENHPIRIALNIPRSCGLVQRLRHQPRGVPCRLMAWLGRLFSLGYSTENKLVANIESWQEPTVVCVQFFHEVWVVEILRILSQEAILRCARLREL